MEGTQSIIILRGAPGSGKTTIARYLKKRNYMNVSWMIVSADDYFTSETGRYQYDATQIQAAHNWCFSLYCRFVDSGKNVILDNTNHQLSEYVKYIKFAGKKGIKPIVYHCVGKYVSTKNISDKVMNIHLNQFQVTTLDLLKAANISHLVDLDIDARLLVSPGGYEFQLKNK